MSEHHPSDANPSSRLRPRAVYSSARWAQRRSPTDLLPPKRGTADRARLVVASNRLPVTITRGPEGQLEAGPAAGGLITALEPVMRERGGVWLGWPGAVGECGLEVGRAMQASDPARPYSLKPIDLSAEDRDLYYLGFANDVLWPLLHGLVDRCGGGSTYLDRYRVVNRRFARAIAEVSNERDFIWVHDYHLLLVGRELRKLGLRNRVGFFLHTPFPAPDLMRDMPWSPEILEGLAAFDLLGFQSPRDQENYQAARGEEVAPARVFPISIDFDEFHPSVTQPSVPIEADRIRSIVGPRTLILGVDRLDYTKGLPEKLRGFRSALREHPELRGRVVLEQLVIPSRSELASYRAVKDEVENLVADINREWARDGWLPVRYHYGHWSRCELLARYQAADVALVTPLMDGMNLVAKEYCVANRGGGVLILSETAGAAHELSHSAILVDPTDERAIGDSVLRAVRMPYTERFKRMSGARELLRARDVHHWVDGFLREGLDALRG